MPQISSTDWQNIVIIIGALVISYLVVEILYAIHAVGQIPKKLDNLSFNLYDLNQTIKQKRFNEIDRDRVGATYYGTMPHSQSGYGWITSSQVNEE